MTPLPLYVASASYCTPPYGRQAVEPGKSMRRGRQTERESKLVDSEFEATKTGTPAHIQISSDVVESHCVPLPLYRVRLKFFDVLKDLRYK